MEGRDGISLNKAKRSYGSDGRGLRFYFKCGWGFGQRVLTGRGITIIDPNSSEGKITQESPDEITITWHNPNEQKDMEPVKFTRVRPTP